MTTSLTDTSCDKVMIDYIVIFLTDITVYDV
jgi:hypothetical protein